VNIVFRVDASNDIGTGHVMRCLALANTLREKQANCLFVSRLHSGHLLEMIKSQGFNVEALPNMEVAECSTSAKLRLSSAAPSHAAWLGADWAIDAQQTEAAIGKLDIDWVVIDHYGIDASWERRLKAIANHIMVIDDLADRVHECDILLDQNWFGDAGKSRYQDLIPKQCVELLGPEFALIRPVYSKAREHRPKREGSVQRILIFLGGSDSENLTLRVLEALQKNDLLSLVIDVVIGVNHPDPNSIEDFVSTRPGSTLHYSLPDLANLMLHADLMIGGGGSTSWERMCLGLPSIVISIADNQRATNIAMGKAGLVQYCGDASAVTANSVALAVRNCLSDPAALVRQSRMMQKLVDGLAITRVADLLFNYEGNYAARKTH